MAVARDGPRRALDRDGGVTGLALLHAGIPYGWKMTYGMPLAGWWERFWRRWVGLVLRYWLDRWDPCQVDSTYTRAIYAEAHRMSMRGRTLAVRAAIKIASDIDWERVLLDCQAGEQEHAGTLHITLNDLPNITATVSGGLIHRKALLKACGSLPWRFGAEALLATIPPTLPVLITGHMGATLVRVPLKSSHVR